ncbi:efflux RND transporter periplasmic adaptor subunit [Neptunomonas phycophila]|uniref:efflux RND transporter periplasmic adaptor subunit n=1 Tax=Neptunomonas phycophila TaxID=1572645 RepID=UPI0026E48D7F|nr:efflux RND transporter periplasmic adaptor subunit [Neptunomonas phycophila]MDO6468284.1 efflux RND transporter periplasmic adaptor subunit [Neptunomonas phycophila]
MLKCINKDVLRSVAGGLIAFCAPLYAATPVIVKPLSSVVSFEELTAPATVVNEQHIVVSAEITAKLLELPVKVGDSVTRDQALAELDCQDYLLYEEQAKQRAKSLSSQVGLASRQLKRTKKLQTTGSVSVDVLNQRQSELNSLWAQLQGGKAEEAISALNVGRCSVLAPFDGVVTEIYTAPGALLPSGAAVVKLLDTRRGEVSAALQPEQVTSLGASENIWLRTGENRYPVTVRSILPFIKSTARTQEVRLEFVQAQALSGATGELVWQKAQPSIPAMYTVTRGDQVGVMLADGNKAQFAAIPGAKPGQSVTTRLSPTAQLIVSGQYVLNDGDEITIEQGENERDNPTAQ